MPKLKSRPEMPLVVSSFPKAIFTWPEVAETDSVRLSLKLGFVSRGFYTGFGCVSAIAFGS